MSEEKTPGHQPGTGNEQQFEFQDSNPGTGGMGLSSERVGPTGPGQRSTDGERDTAEPPHTDHGGDLVGSDGAFVQEPETNPEGIEPRADHPSKGPRSDT